MDSGPIMANRKLEQYLLREDGSEMFLDASDASPCCDRTHAQKRANEYAQPVIVYHIKGYYDRTELYRVHPAAH